MYVYKITNKINNKLYIGITNNYKKRWANHKCCNSPNMIIAKAIKKYGVQNTEIYKLYPQVSKVTIRDIINNKTWTHLL